MENRRKQIEARLRKSVEELKKMRKEGFDAEMREIIRDLLEEKDHTQAENNQEEKDISRDRVSRCKHESSQTL